MFRFAARLQPADAACHVGSAYPDFCTQFFLNLCHPSKCLLRTFRCSLLASDTRKKFLRRFRGDARHLLWQCERSPAPTNWWQATLLHSASSPQCKPTTVNPAKKKAHKKYTQANDGKSLPWSPPSLPPQPVLCTSLVRPICNSIKLAAVPILPLLAADLFNTPPGSVARENRTSIVTRGMLG